LKDAVMDWAEEIRDIGRLISSAAMIEAVRREVRKAVGSSGSVVVNGAHYGLDGFPYKVVVRLPDGTDPVSVARRIRGSFPDVDVDDLAKGVLGVRNARRVRKDA